MLDDTISAIATAAGEGGIGIVRMSGPESIAVADKIFNGISGKKASSLRPFQAAYGNIFDPDSGNCVDEVLIIVMNAPRSYTREDVVEIHCHGGMMPLRKILELTLSHGCRLAEPGEFTKRAFLNGRLDLSQAEAVIDVIRAKSDTSLRMAVSHLGGALTTQIKALRDQLLGIIAHLEANIDFSEEDIDELSSTEIIAGICNARSTVERLLATASAGRVLRDGLSTVIIGKPNVGKSSLLNSLARDERAIVTDIPGTTRDIIEEYITIRGIPLRLIDTAGIRTTEDLVEQIGVDRAKEMTAQADLIILMLDRSLPLTDEDREVFRLLAGKTALILLNKSDLPSVWSLQDLTGLVEEHPVIDVSVKTGVGLDKLEEQIVQLVYSGQVQQAEGAFVSNVRHINLLKSVSSHLAAADDAMRAGLPVDCVVIDLRSAWESLGMISGDTVGEDIIDEIFSRFCIGK